MIDSAAHTKRCKPNTLQLLVVPIYGRAVERRRALAHNFNDCGDTIKKPYNEVRLLLKVETHKLLKKGEALSCPARRLLSLTAF
jgi:hypothetical protein